MNTKVTVAKSTQSAIPELNKPEKNLYYLVIGEGEKSISINVGEKTYEQVKALEKENTLKQGKS